MERTDMERLTKAWERGKAAAGILLLEEADRLERTVVVTSETLRLLRHGASIIEELQARVRELEAEKYEDSAHAGEALANIRDIVAQSVAAERERCARVAENIGLTGREDRHYENRWSLGFREARTDIAARIRSGEEG